MLSEKMEQALNDQINAELYSSYIYLAMAAYCEDKNFNGFASWMKMQSAEEYEHAMKFYEFINRVDGRVKLQAIDTPQFEWDSPRHVFEHSLEHEKYITDRINKLAALAQEENDFATRNFLNWFIEEQVEEVETVTNIVGKFQMVADNPSGLYWLDRELGVRGNN